MTRIAFAFIALATVAACSSGEDQPLVLPGTETGTITIVNNHPRPIAGLFMGRCEVNSRPDRLGAGRVIETGQSRDLEVSAGCYSLTAELGKNSITSTYMGLPRTQVEPGETVLVEVTR